MAIRPDYNIGTVTLVASSANFTTTGASLQTAAVQAGDAIITPSGHVLIIASVTGQNSGTLFLPCPSGAAGSALPLRIRFQPDGSRYQGAVRNLVDLLSSGNVEAFAALVGAAGMVPIFTGPGTLVLADPATFGIQDPNGTLAKFAALTPEASKVFATNGASDPILATIAAILGYTPADRAGDTFTGNVTIAPTGGNGQVRVSIDGTNFNWFNQAQIALRNNTTGIYSYLNGNQVWLLRNGGMQIDLGDFSMTQGLINSIFNGTGTRIRWGQNTASLSGLAVDANGAGQMALYGPAAISYFSGDGSNLLRGTSYAISRGNLSVSGSLSKGSGTFLIDHPLDPKNKNLRHGFVESTEYVNIYRGMVDLVDGRMTVDVDAAFGMMDGTFAALNADVMVTSLQTQYGPERVWVEAPADSGKFTIVCEDAQSTATVAWMVTGRRNDAFVRSDLDKNTDNEGRFVPEFEKEDA